jgi:hypothetical protein
MMNSLAPLPTPSPTSHGLGVAQYIVNPNSRLLEEHAKTIQAQVAKRLVKFKPEALNYTPRVWELPSYDDD